MSRKVFEEWCLKNTSLDLSPFDSLGRTRPQGDDYYDQWETEIAWLAWQAAQQAADKWIPYKEGDVVEDGSYLVSVDGRDWVAIIYHDRGKWVGDNNLWWIDNSHVTAYRSLPPPFVPEVSND